jgi:hypothetical protein
MLSLNKYFFCLLNNAAAEDFEPFPHKKKKERILIRPLN